MARLVAVKESLEKALKDENKFWVKYFVKIEKQTGVNRLYVFLGMHIRLFDALCVSFYRYLYESIHSYFT